MKRRLNFDRCHVCAGQDVQRQLELIGRLLRRVDLRLRGVHLRGKGISCGLRRRHRRVRRLRSGRELPLLHARGADLTGQPTQAVHRPQRRLALLGQRRRDLAVGVHHRRRLLVDVLLQLAAHVDQGSRLAGDRVSDAREGDSGTGGHVEQPGVLRFFGGGLSHVLRDRPVGLPQRRREPILGCLRLLRHLV